MSETAAAIEARSEAWSGLLQGHYSIDPPASSTRYDRLFEEQPSDYLGQQIATHLEALGYLPDLPSGEVPPEAEWRRALRAWQLDQPDPLLPPEARPVEVPLPGEAPAAMDADERAIRLLKAQCTFEGETLLRGWRGAPREALVARIARYRLRTYGLLPPDGELAALDSAAVDLVHAAVCPDPDGNPDLVQLLGDAPELTSRFVRTQHKQAFLLSPGPVPVDLAPLRRCRIRRGSAAGMRRTNFRSARGRGRPRGHRPVPVREEPDKAADPNKTLQPGLEQAKGSGGAPPPAALHRFAGYLLQVRLWMYGYYSGELDGCWGPVLQGALERFAAEHRQGVDKDHALAEPKKWMHLEDGQCVIDLCYLFSYMLEHLDEAAERTEREDLDRLFDTSLGRTREDGVSDEDIRQAEEDLSRDLLAANAERKDEERQDRQASDLRAGAGPPRRRRRYFGWRAIFGLVGRALRWIGKTIKKAFGWIRDKVRQLVHYATTVLNYLREKTRRAVRLVSLGFQRLYHWATGTPVVTDRAEGILATQWSLDFDTVNVALGSDPQRLVEPHLTLIEALNAGFGFLLEIASSVWSLAEALLLPAVNWILVAWRAFKAVVSALQFIDEHEDLLARLEPAVL